MYNYSKKTQNKLGGGGGGANFAEFIRIVSRLFQKVPVRTTVPATDAEG